MKSYELIYLISPDFSEKDLGDFQEKIVSLIQEEGGNLSKVNEPARKEFYGREKGHNLVKNKGEAYLATLNFYLDPKKVGSFEKRLKSENQILRYIILAKPPAKEALMTGKKLPLSKPPKKPISKPEAKVELKEIEKKLEEILEE